MNRKRFVRQMRSCRRMEACGLILLVWVCLSESFNIDTKHPLTYSGTAEDFFGYMVYQSEFESRKQIIVGAPLERNSTGNVYSCTSDLQSCTALHWQDSERVRFFGMSATATNATMTSCSPYLPHECDGNSYLNGICYQFKSNFQTISNFTAAYQECTKREVNLVFMFDGSRSMSAKDFSLNKEFIKDVMKKLSNSSIKFAAIQFATTFRTVFDFNDYQSGFALAKLENEKHMSQLTNTFGAINYVLENLLNNNASGANLKAQHALVIITDGDPTDLDNKNVIKKCDEQKILRYIIGVGNLDLTRLTSLASEPKSNNTFYIKEYNGLEGLLDNLQKKIYNIEGTTETHSKDRQKELSQSGFSVIVDQEDSVIVGSVGSNDWRGSLYEVTGLGSGVKETEIRDPSVSKDSYMGYSAVLGTRGGVSFLFSGAPRAQHAGLVTLFTKHNSTWRATGNITGEQAAGAPVPDLREVEGEASQYDFTWIDHTGSTPIGSYFGGSLSLLDVDSDGDWDFLLVGASLFHQSRPRAEGKLYVCTFSDRNVETVLNVSGSHLGRFAASLASLKDLNGDSLSDVAVGAPLENEGEGAVYIYLGDRTRGINQDHPPQRISGRSVLPGLQQFGVSLSGLMDLSGDDLPDVVIGARGGIALLRARPVMSVSAQLSFSPKEINLNNFECPSSSVLIAFNLTSCLTMNEQTRSSGQLDKSLNVSLKLNVDVMRELSRGFFLQTDPSSKTLQQLILLRSGRSCLDFPIFMPGCVHDTVTPMKIRLNFSQSGNSTAVLSIHSRTEEYVEVLFQRNCNSNNSCVADLRLSFSFQNKTLLVRNQAEFTLLILLDNPGDDSFNTSLVLHYPEGLSLSMFQAVKPSRTRSSCGDRDVGATNRTTCSINLPVYRSSTKTEFLGTFRMTEWDRDWGDTMEMMITANSDNNGNASDAVVRRSVQLQFAVDLAISLSAKDSVTYLNFSLEDRGPKPLHVVYKVENQGVKGLPVWVTLLLPCQTTPVLLNALSFGMQQVSPDELCNFTEPRDDHCGKFECPPFYLNKSEEVTFILRAEATFKDVKAYEGKHLFNELREDFNLNFSAELNYNRSRYNQTTTSLKDDPHKSQITVKAEFALPPSRLLIVGTGAGGGIILLIILLVLLIKCGFFKRKRPLEFSSENDSVLEFRPEDSPLMKVDAEDNGGVAENNSSEKEKGASPEPSNKEL